MMRLAPFRQERGPSSALEHTRPMSHSVANGCKSQPHPMSLEVNSVHLWAISMETWPVLSQPV